MAPSVHAALQNMYTFCFHPRMDTFNWQHLAAGTAVPIWISFTSPCWQSIVSRSPLLPAATARSARKTGPAPQCVPAVPPFLPALCRYDLHVLMVRHGKRCARCASNGQPRFEPDGCAPGSDSPGLQIEHTSETWNSTKLKQPTSVQSPR